MEKSIDVHAHIAVPVVEERVDKRPERAVLQQMVCKAVGEWTYEYNLQQEKIHLPKSTDLSVRFKDMDRLGVDVQVLSPAPMHYHVWADQALADILVRDQNERIAEICTNYPDRFIGLGAAALQHPDLAVSQLRDCVKTHGLKGVEISSFYPGMELADPRLESFWREAESLRAVVMIHPLGSTLGDRTASHYLANIIGQPLDMTLALSHLIFGGVFDRYPQLKILAVHGGGFLPSYIGRFDHAYRARPESHPMQHPPSFYLKRIFFDTVVFRPEILANLIATAGLEQIVAGSDYPYDMGDYEMEKLFAAVPGLDEDGRKAILSRNPMRMLGL